MGKCPLTGLNYKRVPTPAVQKDLRWRCAMDVEPARLGLWRMTQDMPLVSTWYILATNYAYKITWIIIFLGWHSDSAFTKIFHVLNVSQVTQRSLLLIYIPGTAPPGWHPRNSWKRWCTGTQRCAKAAATQVLLWRSCKSFIVQS